MLQKLYLIGSEIFCVGSTHDLAQCGLLPSTDQFLMWAMGGAVGMSWIDPGFRVMVVVGKATCRRETF